MSIARWCTCRRGKVGEGIRDSVSVHICGRVGTRGENTEGDCRVESDEECMLARVCVIVEKGMESGKEGSGKGEEGKEREREREEEKE